MLVLSRKVNESIVLDGNIRLVVLGIRGNQIRLGVEAPERVGIVREELVVHVRGNAEERVAPPPIMPRPATVASASRQGDRRGRDPRKGQRRRLGDRIDRDRGDEVVRGDQVGDVITPGVGLPVMLFRYTSSRWPPKTRWTVEFSATWSLALSPTMNAAPKPMLSTSLPASQTFRP